MPLPDLVVLSHLRWNWVWQRPQHLISRLADSHAVWFVEEPLPSRVEEPVVRVEACPPVTRVWLEVPEGSLDGSYEGRWGREYLAALTELMGGRRRGRRVWLYTPLALEVARALEPNVLIYDVMDDLAAFRGASPAMRLRHRQALREADLVFTGGVSLYRGVRQLRTEAVHLFPSGVDPDHFATAIQLRRRRPPGPPVAGYVGVIDERVDLDLVAELAVRLAGWQLLMVGPVAKIDPATLPQAANISYPGQVSYAQLPEVMGAMDVALMPFARNEATRSISPTKSLEYLAAGLPVVSTPIPDVVDHLSDYVTIAEDGASFAAGCLSCQRGETPELRRRAEGLLRERHWDTIAARMAELVAARSAQRLTRTGAG